jgi:hypothetical protein
MASRRIAALVIRMTNPQCFRVIFMCTPITSLAALSKVSDADMVSCVALPATGIWIPRSELKPSSSLSIQDDSVSKGVIISATLIPGLPDGGKVVFVGRPNIKGSLRPKGSMCPGVSVSTAAA